MLKPVSTAQEIETTLAQLPDDFLVRRCGEYWAVIGRTGLFLITTDSPIPRQAAERSVRAANTLRSGLAEVLDLVPFVDPVVVTDDRSFPTRCAIVEPKMITNFLTAGPTVVAEGELQLLRHHVPTALTQIEMNDGFDH